MVASRNSIAEIQSRINSSRDELDSVVSQKRVIENHREAFSEELAHNQSILERFLDIAKSDYCSTSILAERFEEARKETADSFDNAAESLLQQEKELRFKIDEDVESLRAAPRKESRESQRAGGAFS